MFIFPIMNSDCYMIPKKILCSLLARLGLRHQSKLQDPLPELTKEQLAGMVQTLVHQQGGEPLDLSCEKQAIRERLLSETRERKHHEGSDSGSMQATG
ncbi:MAG: hypothetical protein V4675_03730 [Verrucomicrobiota bacterium]